MSKCTKAVGEWSCTRPENHPGPCAAESTWRIPQYKCTIRYKGSSSYGELSPLDLTVVNLMERYFKKKKRVRFNWSNAIVFIDFSEVSAITFEEIKNADK